MGEAFVLELAFYSIGTYEEMEHSFLFDGESRLFRASCPNWLKSKVDKSIFGLLIGQSPIFW
jgi:hypothetical protein